ncbi:MAG: OadG family protein [Spirochaetaceae bacterium]|jgi:oxaloacetate decarboxylase gamma subunit|nr:OadG family protein [Spirochaetaceae bacterium]
MAAEIKDMLSQSGVLALLGMGTVFGFLIIMIISIELVGKIVRALGWDTEAVPAGGKPAAQETGAVTAAITAAVTEYRKGKL